MVLGKIASEAPQALLLYQQIRQLRRRVRIAQALQRAGWFGAGLAVGGGLTLLLSPRSGREMREQLSGHVRDARDYVMGETHSAPDAPPRASGPPARTGSWQRI